MADNFSNARPLISTLYVGTVFFNSVIQIDPTNATAIPLLPFMDCFYNSTPYNPDDIVGAQCPYEEGASLLVRLKGMILPDRELGLAPETTLVQMRSFITAIQAAYTKLRAYTALDEIEAASLNRVFQIPGYITKTTPDIRDTYLNDINRIMMYYDGGDALTFANLITRCTVNTGFRSFYENSGLRDLMQAHLASGAMEGVAQTPAPAPAAELQTHTIAAESARAERVPNFQYPEQYGDRQIMRFFKERPPEQLATAMLGTACTGDRRAPGCYEINSPTVITMPDGSRTTVQTNLPCTDPASAAKGLCNFKTIPVPWENPVGNSQIYRVYQALDVAAQIKLQLQRALIRYGYAAATLPVYCNKVLDRHFSLLSPPGVGDVFADLPPAVDIARNPVVPVGTTGQMAESTNQFVSSVGIKAQGSPEVAATSPEVAATHDIIKTVYFNMVSSAVQRGETTERYLARNICPHYSRILPRGNPERIPADLQEAFKKDVPAAHIADAIGKHNTFYKTNAPAVGTIDPNFYVPYPIYYAIPGTVETVPNRAYLNEKYIGPGSEGKRQLMMNRASGMLLRSMQHLRNAMVLYIMAATSPTEIRFTAAQFAEIERRLGVNYEDMDVEHVPKGAMAFLTEADKNAMIGLYRALLAMYADNANVNAREVGFFKQITENEHMRYGNGAGIIGTRYKPVSLVNAPAADSTPEARSAWEIQVLVYKRVAYLEVLWSYWYDNNAMGKLRKRMNFRAKLANPTAAIAEAAASMQKVTGVQNEYRITAAILEPYGWYDAALHGLTIAHLRAIAPPPPPAVQNPE